MSLFVKSTIVADIRATRLALIPAAFLNNPNAISDDYIFDKIRSAELEVSRKLTIPLSPVEIFTDEPTDAELAALDGEPYQVEPGYDLPPDYFSRQTWGMLRLRVRPVIAVHEMKLVYPSLGTSVFTVPPNWIRVDKKYGQINVFPSGPAQSAPLSIFTLQAMAMGSSVPFMIRIKYRAGIDASLPEFIDVMDIIKRTAMLHILLDSFIPQSGSISADGLSQSLSMDASKLQDSIDAVISRLKEQLLGPIWGVL